MKKTGNFNINSKSYWNFVYGGKEKRTAYDIHGTDKCTHEKNDTKRFSTALTSVKPGDRVLDMGCGVGTFTKLVKKTYPTCEVWGTDISSTAIEDNLKENPEIIYKHEYIGFQDKLPRDYFDVVFCGETIEHLDEPEEAFREGFEMLKSGGKLIITTPKEDRIQSEEHVWFYTHEDVEKLFLEAGFNEVEFKYLPDMEHLLIIFAIGTK